MPAWTAETLTLPALLDDEVRVSRHAAIGTKTDPTTLMPSQRLLVMLCQCVDWKTVGGLLIGAGKPPAPPNGPHG